MSTIVEERERATGPGSGIGGEWRVIVLNDNRNTFEQVAHALALVIPGLSVDRGFQVADKIHSSGQAIVWSGHKEVAEHYWQELEQSRLTMAPLERC